MPRFDPDYETTGRTWVLRIASLLAIIALIAAIGFLYRRGSSTAAILLLATAPVFAYMFSRVWTLSLFSAFESAKRFVQGAEGDHRHEWYAFKGQRVRVFLDEAGEPWFAANEIAYILGVKLEKTAFANYGPQEYGVPATASEPCLSERGLRRLIKYSGHPDAGALGLWLEREVLRVMRRKRANRLHPDG